MNDNTIIYFMTELFRALDSDNPTESLREAMKNIAEIGRDPKYADAYKQFTSLLAASIAELKASDSSEWSAMEARALFDIMTKIAHDTFQGPDDVRKQLLQNIKDNTFLSSIYTEVIPDIRHHYLFILEKDGEIFDEFSLRTGDSHVLPRIRPGTYSLNYANGRRLWHENLTTNHLVWEQAFSGEEYPMAADTGEATQRSSYSGSMLDGEITVQVLPGLETGTIRITLHETTT